jgi:microcystin-dependent protein
MFLRLVFITIFILGFVRIPSALAQAAAPFLGEIRWVAFNFAPVGWASCNGQLLAINTNMSLYSLIGTTYGGDGINNFALPHLRGRVAIGAGQGAGLTNRDLGATGGSEQQTLTVAQLPAHSHTFSMPASTDSATSASPAGGVPAVADKKDNEYVPGTIDNINAAMAQGQTSSTGNNQPVATMPPFTTLNCIITLVGIFPTQQ